MKRTRRWMAWLLIGLAVFFSPGRAQDPPPYWPMFRKQLLDSGANESVTVADVNKDGRLDIIAGENWFEAPAWKKHRLREIPTRNGYLDDFSNFDSGGELTGDHAKDAKSSETRSRSGSDWLASFA